MSDISASVGIGGRNLPSDVQLVQSLLQRGGYYSGEVSTICDGATIAGIERLQATFMDKPDGRVDVAGRTWKLLSSALPADTMPAPQTVDVAHFRRLVAVPPAATLNPGVRSVNNAFMVAKLGEPRVERDYNQGGLPLTNRKLLRNLASRDVGPFQVTGLAPAVASLEEIMRDVQAQQPELYGFLGHAGMLVVRYVRGSTTAISNHSWGTAIDLKIGGTLDIRGDDQVQHGLTLLAPIFNRHGWYWGIAFRTEDAMHFEAGRDLVEAWAEALA